MLPASTPGVSTVVCTRCFCMLGHFRPALITELFDGTDHSVHRLHLHLFLHVRLRLPERRSTRHTQEVSSAGTETVSARSHCSRQRFRHPWAPAARLMAACGQCETQHRQCCTSVSLRTRTRVAGLPISDVTGPPHSAGLAGLRTRTSGYIMATRASAALAAFLRIVLGSAIGWHARVPAAYSCLPPVSRPAVLAPLGFGQTVP